MGVVRGLDREQRFALLTVGLGFFLIQLAMNPVSAVLPTIAAAFGADVGATGRVMIGYLVGLAGVVLVAGRLGDLYGHKRIFSLGVASFGAGAVLCGLAPDLNLLLALRFLQGIGGAFLLACSLPIITAAFPPGQRGRAVGFVTMLGPVGSVVGVLLSDAFLHVGSWRWIFFFVAPVALATLLALRGLRGPRRAPGPVAVDVAGAALLFGTLTAAALSTVHLHDGPESFEAAWPYHTAMQAIAAVLFVAFLGVELRSDHPLIELGRLRDLVFSGALGANGMAHMTMMGYTVLLPFAVERGLALPPIYTAILLTWSQGTMIGTTLLGGWLQDRTRSPWIMPLCMLFISVGLAVQALLAAHMPYLGYLGVALVLSVGLGVFMPVNSTVAMSRQPQEYSGFASGMLETTRQMGHSLGVSVVSLLVTLGAAGAAVAEPDTTFLAGFQQACLAMAALSLLGLAATLLGVRGHLRLPAGLGAPASSALPVEATADLVAPSARDSRG